MKLGISDSGRFQPFNCCYRSIGRAEMNDLKISEIKINLASNEQYPGLKGFVSFILNGMFRIDGISIRKTEKGKLFLMYPCRTSANNSRFFYVNPICKEAKEAVDTAIFARLSELNREPMGGNTDERTNEVQVQ